MVNRVSSSLFVRLAALASALAMLYVMLTLAAPFASASSPYCGGTLLNGHEYCFGAARNLDEVKGYSPEHSVCVGIGAESGHCSGGASQIATFSKGSVVHEEPWIQDNASGSAVVYGTAYP